MSDWESRCHRRSFARTRGEGEGVRAAAALLLLTHTGSKTGIRRNESARVFRAIG